MTDKIEFDGPKIMDPRINNHCIHCGLKFKKSDSISMVGGYNIHVSCIGEFNRQD